MKLVKPSWEIWEQEPGIQGIYKAIERAGRICYKSEDKITEDSAQPFVDRLIKNGHGAMLEHGTVYLTIPFEYVDMSEKLDIPIVSDVVEKYKRNPYTKWHLRDDGFSQLAFITTNMRVIVENNWLNDLKYLCEPTEFHEKRVCVHFTSDIGTLREFFRHRTMSMAQESTRFCNYSKDRFGKELTFVIPPWAGIDECSFWSGMEVIAKVPTEGYRLGVEQFLCSLVHIEEAYMNLLDIGWTAQQARAVLPLCTKSEAVMTGFVSDWRHFFELRCPANAHPQARELAIPLREEFVKRELIK